MNYLSNKNYIYRDLAARNILLSEENICKVIIVKPLHKLSSMHTYRLLILAYQEAYKAKGQGIPVKWTALEVYIHITNCF